MRSSTSRPSAASRPPTRSCRASAAAARFSATARLGSRSRPSSPRSPRSRSRSCAALSHPDAAGRSLRREARRSPRRSLRGSGSPWRQPSELVALGFSRRKAEYIVGLARGRPRPRRARAPFGRRGEGRARALPGIGEWTADWFLARHLGRPMHGRRATWRSARRCSGSTSRRDSRRDPRARRALHSAREPGRPLPSDGHAGDGVTYEVRHDALPTEELLADSCRQRASGARADRDRNDP